MNKINVIIICIIIGLVFGIIGYLIGISVKENSILTFSEIINKSEKNIEEDYVGTYYSTTWNGKEGVLTLYADKTCKYPTGDKGTWQVQEDIIHLDIEIDLSDIYSDFGIKKENTKGTDRHDATIVTEGLILHNSFFKKMN